ncbi:hypothetical protein [Paenarthrobacter sp. YIM B13468]|uniref:hypothetical protein n=1 Tax=Paenarthrobacter sp. YIM B13468 TaxID=3366295 RepID=UPI0036715857
MSTSLRDQPLTVLVTARSELDAQLDGAVEQLQPLAVSERCGILVTRHSANKFSIEVSPDVPAGMVQEAQTL